jgi:hypothetical protein
MESALILFSPTRTEGRQQKVYREYTETSHCLYFLFCSFELSLPCTIKVHPLVFNLSRQISPAWFTFSWLEASLSLSTQVNTQVLLGLRSLDLCTPRSKSTLRRPELFGSDPVTCLLQVHLSLSQVLFTSRYSRSVWSGSTIS